MTCREAVGLLPLFFDGELDPRQMRAVALHSSRCDSCESELRRMERMQDLVATGISAEVDEIDLSQVWPAVEARLGEIRVPWLQRLRVWWEEREPMSWLRIPVLATAAAAAVLFLLWGGRPSDEPQVAHVPVVDNSATIDFLDSNAAAVALLSEPETNTMVLWVNDEGEYEGEGLLP